MTQDQPTQILGEREIDGSRRAKWSIAHVQLPDGLEFDRYVAGTDLGGWLS